MTLSSVPVDEASSAQLDRSGLDARLVDTGDRGAFGAWVRTQARGFYEGDPRGDQLDDLMARMAHRRTVGVYDRDSVSGDDPVGTVSSWVAPLTTPGSLVESWAISCVTVSPTHRRRGIARAMLEGELRAAAGHGIPVAVLTASEATLYGRYGFGLATFAQELTIDTRRARMAVRVPGRVRFSTPREVFELGTGVFERACARTPGQLYADADMWARATGVADASEQSAPTVRVARYDDADGQLAGFVAYRVTKNVVDETANRCDVLSLVAATDDAYAALWSFVLNLDLVTTVVAGVRSVDEPLLWQLGDVRAARVTRNNELLWTRILDPMVALRARTYPAHRRVRLTVSDPLGFAEGTFELTTDDVGAATVRRLTDAPVGGDAVFGSGAADRSGAADGNDTGPDEDGAAHDDGAVAHVALSVNALSSLYLGGVSAVTLARAGQVEERSRDAAEVVDDFFRSAVTPWLCMWF